MRERNMKRLYTALAVVFSFGLSGCASRIPLAYAPPAPALKPGGIIVAVQPTADLRTDRTIDAVLNEKSRLTVDSAVVATIAASGRVSQVLLPDEVAGISVEQLRDQGVAIVVQPCIERLEGGSSGDSAQAGTIIATSTLVGGFIGTAVAAAAIGTYMIASESDAPGSGEMTIRVIHTATSVDEQFRFKAAAMEGLSKAEATDPYLRSQMAGHVLQKMLEQFTGSFNAFVDRNIPREGTLVPVGSPPPSPASSF